MLFHHSRTCRNDDVRPGPFDTLEPMKRQVCATRVTASSLWRFCLTLFRTEKRREADGIALQQFEIEESSREFQETRKHTMLFGTF